MEVEHAPELTADFLAACPKLGFMPQYSAVHRTDEGTVIKYGPTVRPSEAKVLQLVQQTTTIPVPKVRRYQQDPATGYFGIEMEYIDGVPLELVYDSFDEAAKASIIAQLSGYVTQLRSRRGKWIGTVDGKMVGDKFLRRSKTTACGTLGAKGAHGSEEAFLDDIAQALRRRGASTWTETVVYLLQSVPRSADFVLTHGDLTPENILMRGSEVVGIIGWDQAGFYPDYFEYVKMNFWDAESPFIEDRIADGVLEPHLHALSVFLHARDIIW